MRKVFKIKILIIILALPVIGSAQNLRLSHLWSRTTVCFDLNQLYNYNIYEGNRWGAGFNITTPLHFDERYGYDFQNHLYAAANIGWGTGDEAWKWGVDAALRFPRYVFRGVYASYHHDIERIGNHSFISYNIFNTFDNSSYFSSRYSGIDRLTAGIQLDLPGKSFLSLEYRHSAERLLFNSVGPLYPAKYDDEAMPKNYFDEAHVTLSYGKDWLLDLLFGKVQLNGCGPAGDIQLNDHFWRLLMQYSHSFEFKGKWGSLSVFAQAGTTGLEDSPISRRFDLSGAGGSIYYFRNTLLTVRPNTFMADGFLLGSLCYNFGIPLWSLRISKPRPFVQLNAMWGMLYGKNEKIYDIQSGHLIGEDPSYAGLPTAIRLTAPDDGLLEPVVGLDGLLEWGALDVGVAAALQLTPQKAIYHSDNFSDIFSVMAIVKLKL